MPRAPSTTDEPDVLRPQDVDRLRVAARSLDARSRVDAGREPGLRALVLAYYAIEVARKLVAAIVEAAAFSATAVAARV